MSNKKINKTQEGATNGAATGAIIGSLFGWLIGSGLLTLEGFSAFKTAGPIMAAIAGAGFGGTIGGMAGGLIALIVAKIKMKKIKMGNKRIHLAPIKKKKISSKDIPAYDPTFDKELDTRRTNPHA